MTTRSAKTRAVPRPRPVATPRGDGWMNIASGMGVMGRDKRLGSTFAADSMAQETAEQLWRGDDIAARCVELLPDEMLREDFEVKIAEDDAGLGEKIDEAHRAGNTVELMRRAMYYGRAFGGAGIYLGLEDGLPLNRPVNEKGIRSLTHATVYSPRELRAKTYYADPLAPRYGEVATYDLQPLGTPPGAISTLVTIHESRILRVPGADTTPLAALTNVNPGWNDSIFVRLAQVINDFQAGWQGASILLTDFSTPTLKLKGLAKALAGANKDEISIVQRARMLELCRSIARVSIVDADGEEYKRETTTVTGLAELLDKLALRLAAAIKYPVSLLMGQAPAGLNATGDSEIRWFYDQVKAEQKRVLKPLAKRWTRMLMLAKDGPTGGIEPKNWNIDFPELWQLTEKEQVEVHFQQAQADQLMVQNQVVTPEEIARSRFGGDTYSTRTVIDLDLRDRMAAEEDQQQERLDPTPAVDPNVAAKLAGAPSPPGGQPDPKEGK